MLKNAIDQATASEPLHNDSLNKFIVHQILAKFNNRKQE